MPLLILLQDQGELLHPQSRFRDVQQISRDKFGCFRYATADLPQASLMDTDFAIIALVRRRRPQIQSCPSARVFAPRFLQTPLTVTPLRFRYPHLHQLGRDFHR